MRGLRHGGVGAGGWRRGWRGLRRWCNCCQRGCLLVRRANRRGSGLWLCGRRHGRWCGPGLCRSLRRCRLVGGAVAAGIAGAWGGGMGCGCGSNSHGERRGDTAEKLGCRDSCEVHDRARFCDRVTCVLAPP
jgi:hypothetical protein